MNVLFFAFLSTLATMSICGAQECKNQLMCGRARQFAHDICGADITEDILLGPVRQGKKGPRGLKGERGEAAVVNYDLIMEKVREIYSPVIDVLIAKGNKTEEIIIELQAENIRKQRDIDELLDTVAALNASSYESYMKRKEFCKVYFEGKCFWAILKDITFAEAESICAAGTGGRPAVIYSENHYDLVVEHIRSLTTYTYVWLGLEIDPSTRDVVTLPWRAPAPFLKWHPGYPYSEVRYTGIRLQVTDSNPETIGFYNNNNRLTGTSRGVLCEA